jgi:putative lipoic acid-binding regulatory protein
MIIIIIISIDALAKANILRNKLVDYNIKDKLVDATNGNTNTNAKTSNYEEKKVFKDILEFPTNFTIKIVGVNQPTFVNDIVASIASAINCSPDTIKYSISNSKQNNYISITVTPYFQNADEIYAAYDIISKDSRVKYVI